MVIKDRTKTAWIILCAFFCAIIFAVDAMIPLGVAGGMPYVAVILLTLWLPDRQYPLIFAMICTVLTVIGLLTSPPGGVLWQVLSNRFLAVFVIWVTAILSLQRKHVENAIQNHRDRLNEMVEKRTYEVKRINEQLRREIQETKLAKSKLEEKEAEIQAVLDTAWDAILSINEQGFITSLNPAFEKMFGYSEKELLGKSLGMIMPSPYREEFREYIKKYRETGEKKIIGFCREFPAMRRGGDIFPIELSVAEVWVGKRHEFTGIIRDVSDRKKAEEKVKASEKKYKDLYDNAPDMFISLDAVTRKILECNQTFLITTGYSKEEILCHHISEIYHPDCQAELKMIFDKFVKSGKVKGAELSLTRKDGSTIDVSLSVSAVRNQAGNILIGRSVLRDITEQKRAEQAIKRSREELRVLSSHLQSIREEERTLLSREIHDELGQALTVLKLEISWLKKKLPPGERNLIEKTTSIVELVNNTIQDVKKICTNLRPSLLDDLGLVAALEWQAQEFQNRTDIKCETNLDVLELDFSAKTATAIFRICQEALTNVARHAQATRVIVSLQKVNSRILLEVNDNGKGITRKALEDVQSWGIIGMRERAQSLGGELTLSSLLNGGTVVSLNVPLKIN